MNTSGQTARDARALLKSCLMVAQFEREFAMNDLRSSQRFQALYKVIGKMNQPAASPLGFDVEEDDVEGTAPTPVKVAEVKARPGTSAKVSIEWVAVENAVSSAERRAQGLARVRAERELAHSRVRLSKMVSGMHRAKVESEVRDSAAAVSVLEERLKNGGHTGRLGWMQAQASRGLTA